MPKVSIDASLRAQADVEGEPNILEIAGREFKLAAGAPAGFLIGLGRLQKGDLSGLEMALKSLLLDPAELDAAIALGLDLRDLVQIAAEVYGIDVGESLASG